MTQTKTFSVLIAAIFLSSVGNANPIGSLEIKSKATPNYTILIEKNSDDIEMKICPSTGGDCQLVGDKGISYDRLKTLISKSDDKGLTPLSGMFLGQQAGLVATLGCVLIKKCVAAVRALPTAQKSLVPIAGMTAGTVVGGVAGYMMQREGVDQQIVDLVNGQTGTVEVDESLDSIVENFSALLLMEK